jgi:hypothetical protein
MAEKAAWCLRVTIDTWYIASSPIPEKDQIEIANRMGSYRTIAWEDLDDDVQVLNDDDHTNNTAHQHDASNDRCRPDLVASQDGIGPHPA